jgi:hypothetical protein
MSQTRNWQEVESEVYRPATGMMAAIGTIFLMIGLVGLAIVWTKLPPGLPVLIGSVATSLFAMFGSLVLVSSFRSIYSPPRVLHAAPDVLPDVPNEPVPLEGSIVSGLANELVETSGGWQFRPSPRVKRSQIWFLLGFAIPFSILFAGGLSYGLRDQMGSWPVAILAGATITLLCGGTAFSLIFLMIRSTFDKLTCLTIPREEGNLELEIPPPLDSKTDGLNWAFGVNQKKRITIPRERLLAVQLCPWKFTIATPNSRSTTWAVQGLLVLAGAEGAPYVRQPILLTGDMPRAARLMQQLAAGLQVPYLFGADAAGWRLEEQLARNRPPLKAGGTST